MAVTVAVVAAAAADHVIQVRQVVLATAWSVGHVRAGCSLAVRIGSGQIHHQLEVICCLSGKPGHGGCETC